MKASPPNRDPQLKHTINMHSKYYNQHPNTRTHTHTHYGLLTPHSWWKHPEKSERDRGVASGPGRCDDPALTECQYKAIYKRMKNRPSITGNFSALLPQEAWPREEEGGGGGYKDEEEGEEEEGVIMVQWMWLQPILCPPKRGTGWEGGKENWTVIGQGRELVQAIVIVMWAAEKSPWWVWWLGSTCRRMGDRNGSGRKEGRRRRSLKAHNYAGATADDKTSNNQWVSWQKERSS